MSFAQPHFAEPRWLWLAVIGPLLLLALQYYAAQARRRQLAQVASPDLLATLTRSQWDPLESTCRHASLSIL